MKTNRNQKMWKIKRAIALCRLDRFSTSLKAAGIICCLSLAGCNGTLPSKEHRSIIEDQNTLKQEYAQIEKPDMLWIWVAPKQRKHLPKGSGEYIVQEIE